jgi:5-methylcytosine-specific restriction endonuclease McrA
MNCATCGAEFKPHRPTQRFCSSACYGQTLMRPDPICETCGKPFRYQGASSKNRFCSYACARTGDRTRFTKSCEVCGKLFEVTPSQAARVFCCSRECRTERMHATLTCRGCGQTVRVRRHVATSGKYKGFCSSRCVRDWQKAENHSNWQGGHEKWRGPNWTRQRHAARKRDGYTCQRCGVTEADLGRPLDVHHIRPWREYKGDYKAANMLTNLVSLCPACHTSSEPRRHNRTNRSPRTDKQA